MGFSTPAHADRWIAYMASSTVDCSSYLNGGKLTSSGTAVYCIDDTGISTASAGATYLTLSSATATYLTLSSAVATYTQFSSTGSFLTTSSAAVTYLNNAVTISNALLDVSSITKKGNTFNTGSNLLQLSGGLVPNANVDVSSVTKQGNSFNGATQLVQTNSSSLVPNANIDTSSVTKQANTFNGASQLVQMNSSTQLPAVSGVNLTSLNATNLASGSVSDARLSANVPLLNATQTWTGGNTSSSATIHKLYIDSMTANASTIDITGNLKMNKDSAYDILLSTNTGIYFNAGNTILMQARTDTVVPGLVLFGPAGSALEGNGNLILVSDRNSATPSQFTVGPSQINAYPAGVQRVTISTGVIIAGDLTVNNAANISSTLGTSFLGTVTNDSANTGWIGEYISSVTQGTNIGGSGIYSNAASISLTAGDWDTTGILFYNPGTGTFAAQVTEAVVSTSSGNITTDHNLGDNDIYSYWSVIASNSPTLTIANRRVSISATTTLYLKGFLTYAAGNPRYYGRLSARRVR